MTQIFFQITALNDHISPLFKAEGIVGKEFLSEMSKISPLPVFWGWVMNALTTYIKNLQFRIFICLVQLLP